MNKDKKNLKTLAMQIAQLEKEYSNVPSKDIEEKIYEITKGLSIAELLEIDEYILENNLIK